MGFKLKKIYKLPVKAFNVFKKATSIIVSTGNKVAEKLHLDEVLNLIGNDGTISIGFSSGARGGINFNYQPRSNDNKVGIGLNNSGYITSFIDGKALISAENSSNKLIKNKEVEQDGFVLEENNIVAPSLQDTVLEKKEIVKDCVKNNLNASKQGEFVRLSANLDSNYVNLTQKKNNFDVLPIIEENYLSKILIGIGRNFIEIGEQRKYAGLNVVEVFGMVNKGRAAVYLDKIKEAERFYCNTSVGQSKEVVLVHST